MSSIEEKLRESVGRSADLVKAAEVINAIETAFNAVIAKWRNKVTELENKIHVLKEAITEATTTVNSTNVKITEFFGDDGQGGEKLVEVRNKFKNMEAKNREAKGKEVKGEEAKSEEAKGKEAKGEEVKGEGAKSEEVKGEEAKGEE